MSKKYFISYVCFDKNGKKYYANGIREGRKLTLNDLLDFSEQICEKYDYENLVILNFQKIK